MIVAGRVRTTHARPGWIGPEGIRSAIEYGFEMALRMYPDDAPDDGFGAYASASGGHEALTAANYGIPRRLQLFYQRMVHARHDLMGEHGRVSVPTDEEIRVKAGLTAAEMEEAQYASVVIFAEQAEEYETDSGDDQEDSSDGPVLDSSALAVSLPATASEWIEPALGVKAAAVSAFPAFAEIVRWLGGTFASLARLLKRDPEVTEICAALGVSPDTMAKALLAVDLAVVRPQQPIDDLAATIDRPLVFPPQASHAMQAMSPKQRESLNDVWRDASATGTSGAERKAKSDAQVRFFNLTVRQIFSPAEQSAFVAQYRRGQYRLGPDDQFCLTYREVRERLREMGLLFYLFPRSAHVFEIVTRRYVRRHELAAIGAALGCTANYCLAEEFAHTAPIVAAFDDIPRRAEFGHAVSPAQLASATAHYVNGDAEAQVAARRRAALDAIATELRDAMETVTHMMAHNRYLMIRNPSIAEKDERLVLDRVFIQGSLPLADDRDIIRGVAQKAFAGK